MRAKVIFKDNKYIVVDAKTNELLRKTRFKFRMDAQKIAWKINEGK